LGQQHQGTHLILQLLHLSKEVLTNGPSQTIRTVFLTPTVDQDILRVIKGSVQKKGKIRISMTETTLGF